MRKVIVILTIAVFLFILCSCHSIEDRWQEQYDLGVRYLSEGNYEEAIISFTAAIEIDPNQASAYVGRGQAYLSSDEAETYLASAQEDFYSAIELGESQADAWVGLADIALRQGDYGKALEILEDGKDKTNDDVAIAEKISLVLDARSSAWQEQYDQGLQYLSEGSYEEAVAAFTAAIEIDPEQSAAYEGLAEAYKGLEDIDSALKVLEDGIKNVKDPALQALLEEMRKNITQPPLEQKEYFSAADLEEWGYPVGLSIYDLVARGETNDETLELFEERRIEFGDGPGPSATSVRYSPIVFIGYDNGLIHNVEIREGDLCSGPRGVKLGMQISDVLQLFRCDNENLLNSVEYSDLFQKIEEDGNIGVYFSKQSDGKRYQAFFDVAVDSYNDISYLRLGYSYGTLDYYIWLDVYFNESGVSWICIRYDYN